MDELRTYWEVPAVAHFCSLFRAVFKLIDFDIEDFEEALIVDTESAAEGGRSSLIVDVLTALLRGCLGRRDVTLLNYNQFLHDLLSHRWVKAGFGCNPLGEYRDRACFHILPLYAKAKILHCLCEWRLERPDVELLTKDLNGDSLRVVPLGHDQKGATYWYFYGTRLYREDVVVVPKAKKSRNTDSEAKNSSGGHGRSRRKRRKRNYDFGATKKSKSPKKRHRSRSTSVDSSSVIGSGNDKKVAKLDETTQDDEASREAETPNQQETNDRDEEEDGADEERFTTMRHWKPKLEPDLPTENASASGSSSFPATPASTMLTTVVTPAQQEDSRMSFNDMINRIYSRDEDEEDDDDEKSEKRSRSNSNFATRLDRPTNQSTPYVKLESNPDQDATNSKFEPVPEPMDGVEIETTTELKRPHIPEGPPPWDQPALCPAEPSLRGWSLVCLTMEDWEKLTESFDKPKGKSESDLHEVLTRDFLPAMKDLFDQKEKERMAKVAELAPRRQSDRLEVKRLQKEREEKILAAREREELDRLAKVDDERQKRVEQEKREQRVRLRELEKEKRNLIKERAREERSRRLELRQRRQQLIAEGKEIPEDLLNATEGANSANDQELNELDIEIELEHMYGQLEKLLDQVKESEDAEPFLEPVKEEIAPDYFTVIEKPMDFTKMEDKLLYREYKNKGEFVEDVNLILLNCLQYNGLQSEYTKVAQRLERVFIKAWKKFFPPADLEDSGEDARQEELHCISLLGALDKKIKEDVVRAEMEEKNKFVVDKKELARQRKREADRRRRRLKAEEKRAQQVADKEMLASQSLSSLTSPLNEDGTPKRQSLPAPFLVGSTNMRRPTTMPARGPGGRFLPGAQSEHTAIATRLQRPVERPVASGGGLRTYMPGVSSVTQLQQFKGPPAAKRLLFGQPVGTTSRLIQPLNQGSQQMAPITVHSAGATAAKVIKVSDVGMFSNQNKTEQQSNSGTPGIVASDGSGGTPKGPTLVPKRDLTTLSAGNTFLLNTSDGGARLVRLVTAQEGQQGVASGLTASRLIPPRITVSSNQMASISAALTPTPGQNQAPLRTSTPIVAPKPATLHAYSATTTSATTSTPTGAKPPAKEGVVTLSSKNLMVSIKDKLAYFTKKDETTGELRTVGPVDKDTLVRKLAIYQQQNKSPDPSGTSTSTSGTPKPVCSVAPVRQPPQVQNASAPTLAAATSTPVVRPLLDGQTKPVNAFAAPAGQTVLVSSGSQQFVLLPSQQPQVITIAGGSYILTSNQAGTNHSNTPIYLAAPQSTSGQDSSSSSTSTEMAGVQLIQVMPQIILNSTAAPVSSQAQLVQRQVSQQQVVQIATAVPEANAVVVDEDGASADAKETQVGE